MGTRAIGSLASLLCSGEEVVDGVIQLLDEAAIPEEMAWCLAD